MFYVINSFCIDTTEPTALQNTSGYWTHSHSLKGPNIVATWILAIYIITVATSQM